MNRKKRLNSNSYLKKLIRQFYSTENKISKLTNEETNSNNSLNYLVERLKKIYKKITRFELKLGVKIAGTSLALMLATSTINAQQFKDNGFLIIPHETIYCESDFISCPILADIDGDGNKDLLIGNYEGSINFFKNTGNYSFKNQDFVIADSTKLKVGALSHPTTADLDGDGDLDLFVGDYDGYLLYFKNNGNGTFAFEDTLKDITSPVFLGIAGSPAFFDLDNDSNLDIIAGNYEGTLSYLHNDGNLSFSMVGAMLDNNSDTIKVAGGYSTPTFEDFDADGDLDMIIGSYYGDFTYYTNDGNNVFTKVGYLLQANSQTINTNGFASPALVDIDSDGDLDVLSGNVNGEIEYFNNSSDVFSFVENLKADSTNLNVNFHSAPATIDMDNDGDKDVVVGNGYGFVYFFKNDTNFYRQDTLKINGTIKDFGASAMPVFAKFNDTIPQLFIGEHGGHVLHIISNGTSYTSIDTLKFNGTAIDVGSSSTPAFADADNDGDLDLFVGKTGGKIIKFTNDGTGNFSAVDTLTIGLSGRIAPSFADLDNDNDLDLYIGGGDGKIYVFLNDSTGNFSSNGTLSVNGTEIDEGENACPYFVDFDKDGDADLLVGSEGGNVHYFENITPVTAIKGNNILSTVNVFPNPSNGLFSISNTKGKSLEISDITGKIISQNSNISEKNFRIDLTEFPAGIYILRIYNSTTSETVKIIKR